MSYTSFEKLMHDCEMAYLSKYPLIFIRTDELELVRRVVDSNRFFVRLRNVVRDNVGDRQLVVCGEESSSFLFPPLSDEDRTKSTELNYGPKKDWGDKGLNGFKLAGAVPCLSIEYISFRNASGARQDEIFNRDRLPQILRFVDAYVRDTDDNSAMRNSLCLLYGDAAGLPHELINYCAIIDVPAPETEEICSVIRAKAAEFHLSGMQEWAVCNLAYQLLGFSLIQIEHILHSILSMPDINGRNAIFVEDFTTELIRERKEQLLRREQLLTLVKVGREEPEIGGMKAFRTWFKKQAPCIREAARLKHEVGVLAPRGVLMCGVPGCGKSLAAKTVAQILHKPLLKMDVGNLMGSYLGESEKNMERALSLADAMSPCVLWIDELEKGFGEAGTSGRSSDNGVFRRMFGKLLIWMQENKKACFIFATANDITALPKEFFRSGRFDELFAIYMPLLDECTEILVNQMKRLTQAGNDKLFSEECRDPDFLRSIIQEFVNFHSDVNLRSEREKGDTVVRNCFVTGADIEKLVNIAVRSLWVKNPNIKITTTDWKTAILNALDDTRVYGEGSDNLDSIAMNYIRLIRGGMRPAASLTLFDSDQYYSYVDDDGNVRAGFREKSEAEINRLSAYDRALYTALFDRIKMMAPIFERNCRDRLLRGE